MSHQEPAQRKHFWQHPAVDHDPYPNLEVGEGASMAHLREKVVERLEPEPEPEPKSVRERLREAIGLKDDSAA